MTTNNTETINASTLSPGTKNGLLRVISLDFWQQRFARAHIEVNQQHLNGQFDTLHAAKYARRIEFVAGTHKDGTFNLELMVDNLVDQSERMYNIAMNLHGQLEDCNQKLLDSQVRVFFRHLHWHSPNLIN
jgi:hypothetical protein